jgi:hypothetical protein
MDIKPVSNLTFKSDFFSNYMNDLIAFQINIKNMDSISVTHNNVENAVSWGFENRLNGNL